MSNHRTINLSIVLRIHLDHVDEFMEYMRDTHGSTATELADAVRELYNPTDDDVPGLEVRWYDCGEEL